MVFPFLDGRFEFIVLKIAIEIHVFAPGWSLIVLLLLWKSFYNHVQQLDFLGLFFENPAWNAIWAFFDTEYREIIFDYLESARIWPVGFSYG
jgi:hypothetical protein